MNLDDTRETRIALNALVEAARAPDRPLVVWVGAGVSKWAGYPLWNDLAAEMHTKFSRQQPRYEQEAASQLLSESKFPEIFQEMHRADSSLYFRHLVERFGPRSGGAVYERFIRALAALQRIAVVTTNVDEMIEKRLSDFVTVQRSDIERMPQLLQQGVKFVCKLHGSVSAADTMVFAKSDYEATEKDASYTDAIRYLFCNATVLFLGYGLGDDYVLKSLIRSSRDRALFGAGPHFVIAPHAIQNLPAVVQRIRYVPGGPDHREVLQLLEALIADGDRGPQLSETLPPSGQTLYFIADLVPPGTWNTSQVVMIKAPSETRERQMLVGEGYVDGEVEIHDYSALHDIVVGLLCFDLICVSIDNLGRLHTLLGSEGFWRIIASNSLKIVAGDANPAIIFSDAEANVGFLSAVTLGSALRPGAPTMDIGEQIRRQLTPATGREKEAEVLLKALEGHVVDANVSDLAKLVEAQTHSALALPSIRKMLGVSAGTPRQAIPRWVAYPILRLAKVVRTGLICQGLHASATRMIWGNEKLASAAFSASGATEWADTAASYVLSGQFDSDVGSIIARDPALLLKILEFREMSEGAALRREVALRLSVDEGSQVAISINAGLQRAIPSQVLQAARVQLSGLFISSVRGPMIVPAVWGDLRNSDRRIAGWRKRSRGLFEGTVGQARLGPYSECPCGSGEKVKFCCGAALG
jgi:hypothetical protein